MYMHVKERPINKEGLVCEVLRTYMHIGLDMYMHVLLLMYSPVQWWLWSVS